MKSIIKGARQELNERFREQLKALPYYQEDLPEDIRRELLAFCASEIDKRLKHVKNGQALAMTLHFEIVNSDFSFESESLRNSEAAQKWRKAVYERDGYACRDCGATGQLQAHHIEEWAKAPSRRFDINNGLTLCLEHHAARHPRHAHLIKPSKTN